MNFISHTAWNIYNDVINTKKPLYAKFRNSKIAD